MKPSKHYERQSFNSPDHFSMYKKAQVLKKKKKKNRLCRACYEWWLLIDQILWQHILLQLNISGHEYRSIFWGQLNVLLVCFIIQIKQGMLWDLRDLWCGFSACVSLNSRVTSAIPVFTTTMPEPTQSGCSTGFWVVIQFDLLNNNTACTVSFKQLNYAGGWEVTSLCIVVSVQNRNRIIDVNICFCSLWFI